jgi:hypothetical protein
VGGGSAGTRSPPLVTRLCAAPPAFSGVSPASDGPAPSDFLDLTACLVPTPRAPSPQTDFAGGCRDAGLSNPGFAYSRGIPCPDSSPASSALRSAEGPRGSGVCPPTPVRCRPRLQPIVRNQPDLACCVAGIGSMWSLDPLGHGETEVRLGTSSPSRHRPLLAVHRDRTGRLHRSTRSTCHLPPCAWGGTREGR